MVGMKYNAIVHREDGGFWAEVPDLPGCYTEGDTLDELERNLREAIALYLEDRTDVPSESSLMQVAL